MSDGVLKSLHSDGVRSMWHDQISDMCMTQNVTSLNVKT